MGIHVEGLTHLDRDAVTTTSSPQLTSVRLPLPLPFLVCSVQSAEVPSLTRRRTRQTHIGQHRRLPTFLLTNDNHEIRTSLRGLPSSSRACCGCVGSTRVQTRRFDRTDGLSCAPPQVHRSLYSISGPWAHRQSGCRETMYTLFVNFVVMLETPTRVAVFLL